MLIASVILVIGIGGAYLQLGNFQLTSVALSTIIGMILNWLLPKKAASEKTLEEKNKAKQKQDGKIYQ
jgi:uracil permease